MRRALVIGGSLGGLIAAHLLRSIGWDAIVFERNREELASRVRRFRTPLGCASDRGAFRRDLPWGALAGEYGRRHLCAY